MRQSILVLQHFRPPRVASHSYPHSPLHSGNAGVKPNAPRVLPEWASPYHRVPAWSPQLKMAPHTLLSCFKTPPPLKSFCSCRCSALRSLWLNSSRRGAFKDAHWAVATNRKWICLVSNYHLSLPHYLFPTHCCSPPLTPLEHAGVGLHLSKTNVF